MTLERVDARAEPSRIDVSVVIPTYNGARRLPDTLKALRGQVVHPLCRWEIVVVDNHSTDTTREVVDRLARESEVPVRYAFEPAQGLNHARNRGIRESRGGIVAFTDDDVSPAPDWVQSVILSLSASHADGVGGRILPRWPARPPGWLEDRHLWGALAVRDSEQRAELSLDASGRFQAGAEIWGANMAFRRSLFSEIGSFDPTVGHRGDRLVGGDETEFVRRALTAGRKLVYDPDLVVWHRIPLGRMQKRFFRRKCFHIGEALAPQAASAKRRLLGVPLYGIRFFLIHLTAWLSAVLRQDAHVFCSELELWRDLGFITACARAARPAPGAIASK